MKVSELFEDVLTEAEAQDVHRFIDAYVDRLFEEGEISAGGGDGSVGGDPSPTQAPTEPTGPGGPGGGGTTGPTNQNPMGMGWGNGSRFASAWFATFASQLMWLSSATRINKRLKELGLKGEGARRMANAAVIANKNINLLLNNPGWRQQTWTFAGGAGAKQSKAVAASMKKLIGTELRKVSKKDKKRIYEDLNEGWKSNVANTMVAGAMVLGGAKLIQDTAIKVAPTIAHVNGDNHEYLPANGSKIPSSVKPKSGIATINGQKVKIKYWSQRDMKYTHHYYVKD